MRLSPFCGALLLIALLLAPTGRVPLAQTGAAAPDTSKMTPLELMAYKASQKSPVKSADAATDTLPPLPAGARRLSETPGDEKSPAWGPKGESLYYGYQQGRHNSLRRLGLEDGVMEALTDSTWLAKCPDISPDGRYLVFTRKTIEYDEKLWILRLEDGEHAKLTPTLDMGKELFPHWSPNGMRILYEHTAPASMDSKGMSIGREGENAQIHLSDPGMHSRPVPSRDGKKVVWVHRRGKDSAIKVMDTKISALVEDFRVEGAYFAAADWLPGDRRLVVSYLNTDEPLAGYDLGILDLDSGGFSQFLDLGRNELDPRVSPDGKRLAFCADREGQYDLYVYDLP